jgi:hypothetical protein
MSPTRLTDPRPPACAVDAAGIDAWRELFEAARPGAPGAKRRPSEMRLAPRQHSHGNALGVAPTSRVVFGRIDCQRRLSDGTKVVTRVLRGGSLEVVFTGFHPTPESLVERVVAEGAIAVAISIDSSEHLTVVPSPQLILGRS